MEKFFGSGSDRDRKRQLERPARIMGLQEIEKKVWHLSTLGAAASPGDNSWPPLNDGTSFRISHPLDFPNIQPARRCASP